MVRISFHLHKVKAAIMLGWERVASHKPSLKQLNYKSAVILALLAAPLAVRAVAGAPEIDSNTHEEPGQQTSQPNAKANMDEHSVQSNSSVNVESHASSNSSHANDSKVEVTIDGKKVPMPKNGSVHKHTTDNKGETIVDVQINNDSSASSSSSSSTSINVDHQSFSSGSNDEGGLD